MIILNLMGGLGNLMFQYAYARALSEEYDEDIYLNPYFTTMAGWGYGDLFYLNNGLEKLRLNTRVKKIGAIRGFSCGAVVMSDLLLKRKDKTRPLYGADNFKKMTIKGKYYTNDCLSYYAHSLTKRKYKNIIGYFQSESYFEKIKDNIKNELKVKAKPSSENRRMIEEIQQCNSVCVHIRRGDYITKVKNNHLVICSEEYYKKGMDYIYNCVKDPVFYVFSNTSQDLKWIKNNYKFEYTNIKYVDLSNPDFEELRLMYHCKHFVISNSSFSWWGAYLSEYSEKIIIAPSIWMKNYVEKVDIYTDNMILLDVENNFSIKKKIIK